MKTFHNIYIYHFEFYQTFNRLKVTNKISVSRPSKKCRYCKIQVKTEMYDTFNRLLNDFRTKSSWERTIFEPIFIWAFCIKVTRKTLLNSWYIINLHPKYQMRNLYFSLLWYFNIFTFILSCFYWIWKFFQ